MNYDFRAFVVRHVADIMFLIIFGVKVLVVSHANLRVKLAGSFLVMCVLYMGRAVNMKLASTGTSIIWLATVAIGIRLLAIKIIFNVIDWDD